MSDLIRREDAIASIKPMVGEFTGNGFMVDYERVLSILENIPSADRPSGEWKHDGSVWTYRFNCTNCGYHLLGKQTNYCPHCGAKMKGAEDDSDNI